MSARAYNFCNNCGENGHAFHQCKKPITSIGVLVYKLDNKTGEKQFLMILVLQIKFFAK